MSRSAELVVEARDLGKRYGEGAGVRAALDGVSLEVGRGEFVAVLGPSGCGKSTLLGILGCLDRSFEGELTLFGTDTRTMSDAAQAALRNARLGFVFQAFHLLGHLSALDNVLAPTLFLRERPTAARRDELRRRAEGLLARVGLEGRGPDMPSTLSGGERQRLAIARSLLMDPELLLCDEPTGNLDLATGKQTVAIFHELHEDRGLTIVAVTHEQQLADAADRIVHLRAGRVVEAPRLSEPGIVPSEAGADEPSEEAS
jgi:putative ABC transport system ATP-binding protein